VRQGLEYIFLALYCYCDVHFWYGMGRGEGGRWGNLFGFGVVVGIGKLLVSNSGRRGGVCE
jgi:hypothetical protein